LIAVVVVAPVAGARVHTCHRHSSSTDRPPAQQLKQQQQHGAWEQHLQLCDTEEGCTGCRVCEGTLFTPKIKENRFSPQTPRKKSPAARIVVTHSLGDGAARLPERARSPTPHTSTCGAPPTLRARPNRVPSRKVHPRCCRRRMLASLLRSARLPMHRRVAGHTLTERGPFFRACLHRMHRRLSCRIVHPRCCPAFAGSKRLRASCEDLLDEMDIQEALTLALRVRRHQFDATRATYVPPLQIDARSASPSDGSDPIYRCPPTPRLCMYMRHNEAFLKLRVAVRVLCACSAWH
jgi:hypothetical protein